MTIWILQAADVIAKAHHIWLCCHLESRQHFTDTLQAVLCFCASSSEGSRAKQWLWKGIITVCIWLSPSLFIELTGTLDLNRWWLNTTFQSLHATRMPACFPAMWWKLRVLFLTETPCFVLSMNTSVFFLVLLWHIFMGPPPLPPQMIP